MFDNLPDGTYTVTPSKPNFTFQPASRTVTITNGASVTGMNFVGVGYVLIGTSGYVYQGQTDSFRVVLVPYNGFKGAIPLTIGLPMGITEISGPTSVTISSGVQEVATFVLATSPSASLGANIVKINGGDGIQVYVSQLIMTVTGPGTQAQPLVLFNEAGSGQVQLSLKVIQPPPGHDLYSGGFAVVPVAGIYAGVNYPFGSSTAAVTVAATDKESTPVQVTINAVVGTAPSVSTIASTTIYVNRLGPLLGATGPVSVTVSPGKPATIGINVTFNGTYTGTAVVSAPTLQSMTFNPPSVTLNQSGTANFQVSLGGQDATTQSVPARPIVMTANFRVAVVNYVLTVPLTLNLTVDSLPVLQSVLNAVSFAPTISPGCLIAIFGSGLASSTVAAKNVPLPTTLGTTSVTVGGRPAPLYFVSPTQINAQLPFEVTGDTAPVVVTVDGIASTHLTVYISPFAPSLFSAGANGTGMGLYFDANFQSFTTPLVPGSTIILYASGLGATNPPATSGSGGAATEPFNRVVTMPDVYIGDVKARVDFAGLAPGFVGVYQLNVVVPSALATNRIYLASGAWRSNVIDAVIAPGDNTRNASGMIQALYPLSGQPSLTQIQCGASSSVPAPSTVGISPVALIVQFSAKFDVLLNAKPFVIAAVSEAGRSLVSIDPLAGTMSVTATSPTFLTRIGDFSSSGIPAVDLITGLPFPANIIPEPRQDPVSRCLMRWLPIPNSSDSTAPGTLLTVFQLGPLTPGSTIELTFPDPSHEGYLYTFFGGWLFVPYSLYINNRNTTLKLFIDGSLVATTNVPFVTP